VAPAVFGSSVVVGNSAGELLALELGTGEVWWQGRLPQRLGAEPAQVAEMLLVPGRDGQLFRLGWQESGDRPAEEGAFYEAAGEWEMAAVAHALAEPPRLEAAGHCLLRAEQPERALQLFQAAGDDQGAAEALAKLGRLEEALASLPAEARAQRAAWLGALGHYNQAGELYAELEEWEAAGEAFEAAHRPLKAVRAYHQAGLQEDVVRLAAGLDLEAVQALVDVLGWEAALARFREAGQLDAAADLLEGHEVWEEALALRRQQGNWERVREICHQLGIGKGRRRRAGSWQKRCRGAKWWWRSRWPGRRGCRRRCTSGCARSSCAASRSPTTARWCRFLSTAGLRCGGVRCQTPAVTWNGSTRRLPCSTSSMTGRGGTGWRCWCRCSPSVPAKETRNG
jgi:tetratricopeptide (TPR) repeat protein